MGKTSASLYLAPLFRGEIVNADSRQIYRHMDVGTAKPSLAERAVVPHHLIDIVDPDQEYSLALYQRQALAAIRDVHQRGKLPILVGGSGLYVRAVAEGLAIPSVPPDPDLRSELEARAQREGPQALHAELRRLDLVAAGRIDARNVRRVVRALEVTLKAGTPISELQRKRSTPFRVLKLGLTIPREELYRRIDERVDWQIAHGLIEENMALRERGYGPDLPAMSSLGYRQIAYYLDGRATLDEAVALTKNETHRFARQQNTWFRPTDSSIHWLASDASAPGRMAELVGAFLADQY